MGGCDDQPQLLACEGSTPRKKIWYAPHKFEAYGDEEIEAVTECLRAGWLAPGPRTAQFEEEVAAFFGKKLGVFVNSGSSANMLALLVAGVSEGVEVVTPALTFSTVIAPLLQLRAKIVFCDAMPTTYVASVDQVMAVVTEKTKVIFLPNLIGSKPDWAALRARITDAGRSDIVLIEDSCDTMTHTPESDISVISFYASHVITAGGSGGMLMVNSLEQKNIALQYRDWGRMGTNVEDMSERFGHSVDGIEYDFKFLYSVAGYNFKSSEMNAAFGLAQMKKLDGFLAIRRKNTERYLERLKGSSYVLPDDSQRHNWLAFPLQHKDRKACLHFLEEHGVQTRVCFAGNVTRHPAFRHYFQPFAIADEIMANGFLLGGHHGMTEDDVDYVCDLLLDFDRRHQAPA